jgi:hypothetical protein
LALVAIPVITFGSSLDKVHISNGDRIRFHDHIEAHNLEYVTDNDRSEISEWRKAIRRAADLLPTDFIFKSRTHIVYDPVCLKEGSRKDDFDPFYDCPMSLKPSFFIDFYFFIDTESWVTATPERINLRPSATRIPSWMTWEPFSQDGFTNEERLWIGIHELSHLYFVTVPELSESAVTYYGCVAGDEEDWADAVSLYVMYSEQLKEFPQHYGLIKDTLKREYKEHYKMPNSVRSKLADPLKGCDGRERVRDYSIPVVAR